MFRLGISIVTLLLGFASAEKNYLKQLSVDKTGQEVNVYVSPIKKFTPDRLKTIFETWSMNMQNCCKVEIEFEATVDGSSQFIVRIPDGKSLYDFGRMLHQEKNCSTYTVDNVKMYCRAHPEWDRLNPGKSAGPVKTDATEPKTEL